MQSEPFVLGSDPAGAAAALRSLVPAPESVREVVAEIVADVRRRGESAVREYTAKFDAPEAAPRPLSVVPAELDGAVAGLAPAVRAGLELAIANVEAVCVQAGPGASRTEVELGDHMVALRREPLARAGIYVPGGRAPYPSTVVMGVVPARMSGVEEIVVSAPPRPDGEIDPVVLAASRLAGATAVLRAGGAQGIAALAYGTESVAAVDVIVGPGNLFVQEAKRQVSGSVAIDGFAGPSDLLVLADESADPGPVALDLLAQAEHGHGTLVVGLLGSEELLSAVAERLERAPETGAVARLAAVAPLDDALRFIQAFAPEHLELIGPRAESLAPRITHAGCVFVGREAATAFGDYIAGSNHILPTGGAARFASALSVEHFMRRFTEVRVADGTGLARAAAPLARAEGFEWHARSMEARIRDNGADGPSRGS